MDQNPKQQIVEKLLSAKNVLVTVSKNPNVDQLASAIGMTLMQNALDSRAVAVFSGEIPNVLEFLEPEKNFDKTVDSLRDFIISIDKEKADKLRYKVEGDLVRIFITPYKTTITDKDLDFSQGDFNVDVVLALGVSNRNDLDQAIISHGRILHDATIASVTAGSEQKGDLGAINWHDPDASSISEMLVSMSEALKSGILDKAMSTAFLTGIVSSTERFSNNKTTPKVMTMSAQLMAAGADQQLISKNLRMDRGRTKVLEAKDKDEHREEEVFEVQKEVEKPDDGKIDLSEVEKQIEEAMVPELEPAEEPEPPATLPPVSEEPAPDPSFGPDQHPKIIPDHKSEATNQRHMAESQPSGTGLHKGRQSPLDDKVGTFSSTSENARKALEDASTDVLPRAPETPVGGFTPDVEVPSNPDEGLTSARDEVSAALSEGAFKPDHHPAASVGAQSMDLEDEADRQIKIDPSGNMSVIPDSEPVPPPPPPSIPPPLPAKPETPPELNTPLPGQTPENPLFKQQ